MVKKVVVTSVVAGSLLFAQKITDVKFEGLSYLSSEAAMEVAGIHPGENVTSEQIDASIAKLFAKGYFSDVSVDQKGSTLIYHLKERPTVANVEMEGFGSDDEAKRVLQRIGLKKGDFYDDALLAKAKKQLSAYLESTGSYDSVIDVSQQKVGDHAVALKFKVNKGEKIKIKQLNFKGAKALSKSDLEQDLVNKEEDFLGWLPLRNDGEVHVDQLEYDALRLKETYMQHGYLDAKVSTPLMRVNYSDYSAQIDYNIVEGPQYRVGRVSLQTNLKELDSQKLLSELKLKEGKIFNIKRMRQDMEMLKAYAGDLGYAYASVSPKLHKNPQQKTVDLQYVIHPGKKVHIHDVLISGNSVTKDRVIRRYIYLAPGDTFSATDLKDSKGALGRTGFFEHVDIQTRRISDDQVDLLVKVKEASTGSISLGGGYGSYEGLMLNASISDKNLLGSGINGSFGFDISKISTSFNLSFVNPRVWDSPYSLGLSLYKKEYEYEDYTEDRLGGSLTLGRQFGHHIHATIGLGYVDNQSEYNEDYDFDELERLLYDDQYTKTSGFVGISWDNTDDYYLPREGYLASLNVEFASMDGDDYNPAVHPDGYGDFTRYNVKFGAYYGLEDWIDYDMILRFKARGSYISKDEDAKLPVAERLFMGGIGSVRGYQAYSLSPELPNGDAIGGTYRTSISLEASVPLSEAAKMRLAFFYDYGVLGSSDEHWIDEDGAVHTATFDNIERSSVGAVVEWQSGFGPINLVFGYALDEEPGDETSTFEFSMGTKF